jgi:hypothetical protein
MASRIMRDKKFEERNRKINKSFIELYSLYYPSENEFKISHLGADSIEWYYTYGTLLDHYYAMDDGDLEKEPETLCLWLVKDLSFDILSKALFIVLAKSDGKYDLNVSDYILMTYVSLQDEQDKALLEGLSLSLLHDMFDPVAEEKYRAWINRK